MCNPMIVAAVASVAAAGIAAVSAQQQGEAADDAAEFNAKVAENNAKVQAGAAAEARRQGSVEAESAHERGQKIIAAQRVAEASQGMLVDSGSGMDLQAETAGLSRLDTMMAANNATRRAYGYEVGQGDLLADAQLGRMRGKAARTSGYLSATGSILGGISTGASAYGKLNDAKVEPYITDN